MDKSWNSLGRSLKTSKSTIGVLLLVISVAIIASSAGLFVLDYGQRLQGYDYSTKNAAYFIDINPESVDSNGVINASVTIINLRNETENFSVIIDASFIEGKSSPVISSVRISGGSEGKVAQKLDPKNVKTKTRTSMVILVREGSSAPKKIGKEEITIEPALPKRTSIYGILATVFLFSLLLNITELINIFGQSRSQNVIMVSLSIFGGSIGIVQLFWPFFGFINDTHNPLYLSGATGFFLMLYLYLLTKKDRFSRSRASPSHD